MKNKKPLIALAALLLIGVVGVTFAYFTQTKVADNIFTVTGGYKTEITEEFESPDSWLPGEKVTKDVNVRNSGDVDMVVRVKMKETWVQSDDVTGLTGQLSNGENAAVIGGMNAATHGTNGTVWKLHTDGYYYYTSVLPAGQTTSTSFMTDVTLNPNMDLENDASYLGSKLTLSITAETVQKDGAVEVWGEHVTNLINGLS